MKFEIGKFYTDGNGNVFRFQGTQNKFVQNKLHFERDDKLCWSLNTDCAHDRGILESFTLCSDENLIGDFLSKGRRHGEAVVADYAHAARKGWDRA